MSKVNNNDHEPVLEMKLTWVDDYGHKREVSTPMRIKDIETPGTEAADILVDNYFRTKALRRLRNQLTRVEMGDAKPQTTTPK